MAAFHKVNTHSATTEEEIKKMLASFGCEVKRSFSKNTPYVCVGKSANTSKIKSTNKRQVEVFNLWRLQKLLLGQLTIETMQQIDQLTRDSLKGVAYEAAESLTTTTEKVLSTATD